MSLKLIRTSDYEKLIRLVHIQVMISLGKYASYDIEKEVAVDASFAKEKKVYKIESEGGTLVGFVILDSENIVQRIKVKKQFNPVLVASQLTPLVSELV